MKLITFYRVIKSAWKNFFRNGWLSAATISIMVITLLVIGSLMILNVVTNTAFEALQDKIDISVYLKLETSEQEIIKMKNELLSLPEIQKIEYVSQTQAIASFKNKHEKDQVVMQSLTELDKNPLEAVLNIKAKEASLYASIASFLETSKFRGLISKVNYEQNKYIIEKFNKLTAGIGQAGLIISVVFAVIALLVTFNTVRLAIYTYRREIEIMRLVGAKNWYIRWPFIIEGVLYGFFSGLICLAILYVGIYILSPKLMNFLPQADLMWYFNTHILMIAFALFSIGIGLGSVSSVIAIRRYLKN